MTNIEMRKTKGVLKISRSHRKAHITSFTYKSRFYKTYPLKTVKVLAIYLTRNGEIITEWYTEEKHY